MKPAISLEDFQTCGHRSWDGSFSGVGPTNVHLRVRKVVSLAPDPSGEWEKEAQVWEPGRQPSTDGWVRQLAHSHIMLWIPQLGTSSLQTRTGGGMTGCGEERGSTSAVFHLCAYSHLRGFLGSSFPKVLAGFLLESACFSGCSSLQAPKFRFVYTPLAFLDPPVSSPLVFHLSCDVSTFQLFYF